LIERRLLTCFARLTSVYIVVILGISLRWIWAQFWDDILHGDGMDLRQFLECVSFLIKSWAFAMCDVVTLFRDGTFEVRIW
jgi:hypothetical protein